MITNATCARCGRNLPLDCGLVTFRLPPRTILCRHCQTVNETTAGFRSRWMGQQIFRGTTYVGVVLGISIAMFMPDRFVAALVFGTILGGLLGMAAATVLAVFVAPIVRIWLDVRYEARQLHQSESELVDDPAAHDDKVSIPPPLPHERANNKAA